jgi:hypothetical protein
MPQALPGDSYQSENEFSVAILGARLQNQRMLDFAAVDRISTTFQGPKA